MNLYLDNFSSLQKKAIEKFDKLKVGALFMQMGTGKTRASLEIVKSKNPAFLIYITPVSTINNVKKEFDKWNCFCEFEIIGYETISSSRKKYLNLLEKLKNNKNNFIIADESTFIKNEKTKRYIRLLELRKYCEFALILTGTPLTLNEFDLFNQMNFLSKKIFKMTRTNFESTFFEKIIYKRKNEKEKSFLKFSEVNEDYLKNLLDNFVIKGDFLLDGLEEKEKYNFIFSEKSCLIEYENEKIAKLQEMQKMGINSQTIIILLQNLNKISSLCLNKINKIKEYCKEKQVIVFCNFLEEQKRISENLDCFIINGSIKKEERVKIIEEFENSNKPLILTFGTGSFSLNLQFCNEIVYSSLNFDYAKMEQSKYRIKRIGQKRNIKYTYFLSNFKINNLILDNLTKKQNLLSLIKKNVIDETDLLEKIKGGVV